MTLSPQPDDFALAELAYPEAGRRASITARSLRITVPGPFGDDYMAATKVRLAGLRKPAALVVLVNRPSALLDPTSVRLQTRVGVVIGSKSSAESFLGWPRRLTANNPLAHAPSAPLPKLCTLPLHGAPLAAANLLAIASRGSPLTGVDGAGAVAEAYDITCGLAHSGALEQDLRGTGSPPAPTPAPAPVTPSPQPPLGRIPGEGCTPAPGYACPG